MWLRRLQWRPARSCALLAVVLLAAGCASKGIVHNPAPLQSIDHPQIRADVEWARQVGNGSGDLWTGLRVVAGEDAVFAAAESGWVYAFAPKTGKTVWLTPTHARVIAGPTVSGDEVVVGTTGGQVIALRRSDGKLLWRAHASGSVIAAPAIAGGKVVARGVDGRVFAFDSRTGKRLWSFDRSEPNLTLRGQAVPLVVGTQVLVGQDDGKIVALDLATGKRKWTATLSQPHGRSELGRLNDVDAALLDSDQGVFAVSYGGNVGLIDPSNGEFRWRRPMKSYSGMALHDGTLFVTDDDGYVHALNATTGAPLWTQKALKYRALSPPCWYAGFLVVGDYAGYLHWLDPKTGKIVGRAHPGSAGIVAAPVAGAQLLYAMDAAGDLIAYHVRLRKH